VICGLSGGVDSRCRGLLILKRRRIATALFVVMGCCAKEPDAETVVDLCFGTTTTSSWCRVDASKTFRRSSPASSDPTERKTIGGLFIEVVRTEAKKIGGADSWAGPIITDVIESVCRSPAARRNDQ